MEFIKFTSIDKSHMQKILNNITYNESEIYDILPHPFLELLEYLTNEEKGILRYQYSTLIGKLYYIKSQQEFLNWLKHIKYKTSDGYTITGKKILNNIHKILQLSRQCKCDPTNSILQCQKEILLKNFYVLFNEFCILVCIN